MESFCISEVIFMILLINFFEFLVKVSILYYFQMSRENYELTGQKVQGYTISKPIGQGKFSIVYRA
jgi:hypothetical protein